MAEQLETGRQRAGLTSENLWMSYCSLGGMATPAALDSFLAGSATPTGADYDVIAQALNDTFVSGGSNHLVPYSDEIAG